MKTIKTFFLAGITLLLVSCELDNFDGPDAQVYGTLIDDVTGETIQQEIGTSGDAATIQVIEYGYSIRAVQNWKIKTTGEYRNNLVFSGTYDIILNNGNFVKLDTLKAYNIKSGENRLDFKVIPNIRIMTPKIEKTGNSIIATFLLQYGHATGKVKNIALFAQTDENPSSSFNIAKVERNVEGEELTYQNNSLNENRIYTISIDLNSDEGKKLRTGMKYFFRIGALPTNLGEGIQAKYNYSPVVGIQL